MVVNRSRPISTVLFDVDGTLTDSAPGMLACFAATLEEVGVPPVREQVLRGIIGPPMLENFLTLGLGPDEASRACALYFDRYAVEGWNNNSVFDGIAVALQGLRDLGCVLGVATSKKERFAKAILDHFELSQFFDFIGTASDDETRNTKRDVIEYSLHGLGVDPLSVANGGTAGVVMVGDRIHDVEGAAHWSIPTIMVEWGYGSPEERAAGQWIAEEPCDLVRIVQERNVSNCRTATTAHSGKKPIATL